MNRSDRTAAPPAHEEASYADLSSDTWFSECLCEGASVAAWHGGMGSNANGFVRLAKDAAI